MSARRTALLAAAGALLALLAFVLLPAQAGDAPSLAESLLFRGLLAGAVAALLVRPGFPPLAAAALAAVASAAGVGALSALGVAPLGAFQALAVALAALAALLGGEVARSGRGSWVAWAGLVLVAAAFLWHLGVIPGVNSPRYEGARYPLLREPAAESYHADGMLYVKTYWVMRRGVPFYQAFRTAFVQDARFRKPPSFKLNYREPWLFEAWRLLPGPPGAGVWYAYVAVALLGIAGGWLLARSYAHPAAALLAPAALAAYFAWPAAEPSFTFAELWAAPFAILAVLALLKRRWAAAAAFVIVAVAFRELMAYLLPVVAVAWLAEPDRREHAVAAAVAVGVPAALLAAHLALAPATGGSALSASMWEHSGVGQLLGALRWSAGALPFGAALLPLATLGALAAALLAPQRRERLLLLTAVLLPPLLFAAAGSGPGGEYWGAISQPLALALAPFALSRLLPRPAAPASAEGLDAAA